MAKHDSDAYMSEADITLYYHRAAIVCELVRALNNEGVTVRSYTIERAVYALQKKHDVPLEYPFALVGGEPRSCELWQNVSSFIGEKFLTYEPPERYGVSYHADGERLPLLRTEYGWLVDKYQDAIDEVVASQTFREE